jgi:hypothetical protein
MRFVCHLLLLVALWQQAAAQVDPLSSLRPGHPRLLVSGDAFERMREAAAHDPLRAKLHQQIERAAEASLPEPPIAHVLVGPRMLDQSRKAMAHILNSAMAYRLGGDRRYLEHAREVMLTAAAFPDWNPSHFLDVAEMATALALGYDWLFDELTADERSTIRRALVDKALVFARPAYGREDPTRESFPFVGNNLTNNWNQVCNGGFLLAALAIAEDEPALAREVIAGLRETLPHAMAAYEPDGAYPEGPVYWGYGSRFNVVILAALQTALNTDFGLSRQSAFDATAFYRIQVESPTGLAFNYADGGARLGADSALAWFAQRFDLPAVMAFSRRQLEEMLNRPPDWRDRFLATFAIWFPTSTAGSAAALPLDAHFRGASEIAVFRSAWNDPRALFVGFKAGSNRVNHGHLDLGSFVFDADGERWASDLGPDDYNLPGYWETATVDSARWRYFRLNNRSHNTVRPDDALQQPDAVASIVAFKSTPASAFAVTDLTAAYPGYGRRFQRGIAMLERSRVLVQDEVDGLKSGTPLTWQMVTAATVAIDGARATLTQKGQTLRIEIIEPASARFTVRPATPPTPAENQNEGFQLLSTQVEGAASSGNVRLAILLIPGANQAREAKVSIVPLSTWK